MISAVIHIFGLPTELGTVHKVEVQLKDKAGMAEVVAALREKVPGLENIVIRADEDRLEKFYRFNINGRLFFDGMDFELHEGDKIALLMPPAGG
ncbi:MoaD/ThiS family protein [Thermodesulfobacteriota bacterium]